MLKDLEIKCILECNLFVFLDIRKVPDFRWKNPDVSRTQRVCHVIHIFFGSSLGKVQFHN